MRRFIFLFLTIGSLTGYAAAPAAEYFKTIQSDPNALYAFLYAMPKGGELHYHLAGGAYPEHMIELGRKKPYCLDPKTHAISSSEKPCGQLNLTATANQPELYNETIKAWSMKDFTGQNESAHDHFFSSFYKFIPIVVDYQPELLAKIMQRAASQNELYMEIMILPDNARASGFAGLTAETLDIKAKRQTLLKDRNYQKNIQDTVSESERILKQARRFLGCDTAPSLPACQMTIKFQYYILREQPLPEFFAQALNGFEAASLSDLIGGINLVQPEDGIISVRDFHQQMTVLNELHTLYPKVHIALHAGELTHELVEPEVLKSHIHDSIFTGHAERIGHGVDVAYEQNARELVRHMAQKPIPVEINLTSNRIILNVQGKNHPLRYYLNNEVPVVISTDDEGILRTDLTREYVEAVMNHGIDYDTLKTINRNTLTYSFLPGKSLFKNPKTCALVKPCETLDSPSCQSFIASSEKARLQWQLEKKLARFEAGLIS